MLAACALALVLGSASSDWTKITWDTITPEPARNKNGTYDTSPSAPRETMT